MAGLELAEGEFEQHAGLAEAGGGLEEHDGMLLEGGGELGARLLLAGSQLGEGGPEAEVAETLAGPPAQVEKLDDPLQLHADR
jgi:hypothetical protein